MDKSDAASAPATSPASESAATARTRPPRAAPAAAAAASRPSLPVTSHAAATTATQAFAAIESRGNKPSCRAAASKAGAASVARQPAAPATRTPLNGARRGIFARASGALSLNASTSKQATTTTQDASAVLNPTPPCDAGARAQHGAATTRNEFAAQTDARFNPRTKLSSGSASDGGSGDASRTALDGALK